MTESSARHPENSTELNKTTGQRVPDFTDHGANVDPREVDKFSEIASHWWDLNSEFKPLHDINPLRLEYIDEHASVAGKTVADIGCGGGILSESLARRGAAVTGIDMSQPALAVARLHALENDIDIRYLCESAEQHAASHCGHYDVVTCMEMLEHVPQPALVVSACATMLKPGGTAVFSTISRNAKSWLHAIVGAEYLLKLLPKGTHEWDRFIKPSELANHCRQADLQCTDISGMVYNPLSKVYSLSSNVDVNYLLVASRAGET